MLNEIIWPEGFLPGRTDNFASNEIIVSDLSALQVWPYIADTSFWPEYYSNASEINLYDSDGTELYAGARFRFTTFGLVVEAKVTEFVPPAGESPARIAWHGWCDEGKPTFLDVHHAWLLENLPGGRVRILTQETQNGLPAKEMAVKKPNPMINAHQEWIEGLAKAAKDRI